MNRILALVAGLALAGAAFAAEPVKGDGKAEPGKVESSAPKSESKPTDTKDTKKTGKSTKAPKGRRTVPVNGNGSTQSK